MRGLISARLAQDRRQHEGHAEKIDQRIGTDRPVCAANAPLNVTCSTGLTNLRALASSKMVNLPLPVVMRSRPAPKSADEHNFPGILTDIDETAGTGKLWSNFADV